MCARKSTMGLALTLCLLMGVLVFASMPAQASILHPYTGTSFGPVGVGSRSFANADALAVEQSSGDVFVLDSSSGGRVYKFNASGEPVSFSATKSNVIESTGQSNGSEVELAVDDSSGPDAGDIYVANNEDVHIYAATGAYLGELSGGEMCGVAVGTTGEVYVGIYPETVRRYTPVTNPVTNANESASMGGVHGVCNVAVDGAGDVYAAHYSGEVNKYEALQFGSLSAIGELVDEGGRTLAADPANGEVFIDEVNGIAQYEGSAKPPKLLGSSGSATLTNSFGVGVNHASGELYAADSSRVKIFGPGETVASATTEAATGVTSTGATLHGTVEPSGVEVTSCSFEYGTNGNALNRTAPCTPTAPYTGSPVEVSAQLTGLEIGTSYYYRIAAHGAARAAELSFRTTGPAISNGYTQEYELGAKRATLKANIDPNGEATTYDVEYGTTAAYGSTTEPVELEASSPITAVSVPIVGLQPGTTYHFRFVAVSAGGTATGQDDTFTTLSGVNNESFSEVGSNSAVVSAEVDPIGEATTYQVEYGPSTAYGSSTQPISAGAGEALIAVAVPLGELAPGTVYHFRFVAVNGAGASPGPDVSFTTHPLSPPGLPDGRLYEMVTPPENEGAEPYAPYGAGSTGRDAIPSGVQSGSAFNGDAVIYGGSPTATGNGSQGAGKGNQFIATRNPEGGWTQTNLQPQGYNNALVGRFSNNLEKAIVHSTEPLSAGVPSGYMNLYLHNNEGGGYQPSITLTPPNRSANEFQVRNAGASADFSHQLVEANDALASGAVDPGANAYNLYDWFDGQLHTVNVLPDGSAAPNAVFGGRGLEGEYDASRAIAADGNRIFWTDQTTGSLYVRENDTSTSLIATEARYLLASTDGSKVLYVKGGDLYEDDLDTSTVRDLAPGGQVLGLMGAGEDLEFIYVVGDGALSAGASAGHPNLYLLHGGATTVIATLGEESYAQPHGYPWTANEAERTAAVTASGKDLVFMSFKQLTSYDNEVRSVSRGAYEVYYYDAASGTLSCPSCNSSGERPTTTGGFLALGADLHQISDDGQKVFFESAQPLLPQAKNDKLNVYEWEPDGSSACHLAGGCLYLLSTGASPSESYFVGASSSGDDVFLMTRSQLVPADKNEYFDIYDARVGAVEPPVPPQCTGTGCQGPAASPPIFSTPASFTFAGVGNFEPPAPPVAKPNPKPKKKAHSCTAKKAKKASNAKKAAKRGKAKPVRCTTKRAAKRVRPGMKGKGTR